MLLLQWTTLFFTSSDTMNCPLCQGSLQSAHIEGESVAYCGRCEAFLADMETLPAIVTKRRSRPSAEEKSTAPFDAADLTRVLRCPQCKQPMDTHPYFGGGNVVVSTCERCNFIWLDAGTLEIIERYVPYMHQIERTITPYGGRYQGGPRDMPSLGILWDRYWRP